MQRSNNPQLIKKEIAALKAKITSFAEKDHQKETPESVRKTMEDLQKAIKEKNLPSICNVMLMTAYTMMHAKKQCWEKFLSSAEEVLAFIDVPLFSDQEGRAQCELVLGHFNAAQMAACFYLADEVQKSPLVQCMNALLRNGPDRSERIRAIAGEKSVEDILKPFSTLLSIMEKIQTKLKEKLGQAEFALKSLQRSYFFYGVLNVIYIGLDQVLREAVSNEVILTAGTRIEQQIKETCGYLTNNLKWQANKKEQHQEMVLVMLAQHILFQYTEEEYTAGLSAQLFNYVQGLLARNPDKETCLLIAKYSVSIYTRVVGEGDDKRIFYIDYLDRLEVNDRSAELHKLLRQQSTENNLQEFNQNIHPELRKLLAKRSAERNLQEFNKNIHQKLDHLLQTDAEFNKNVDAHIAFVWTKIVSFYLDYMNGTGDIRRPEWRGEVNIEAEVVNFIDQSIRSFDGVFYRFFNGLFERLSFLMQNRHALVREGLDFLFSDISFKLANQIDYVMRNNMLACQVLGPSFGSTVLGCIYRNPELCALLKKAFNKEEIKHAVALFLKIKGYCDEQIEIDDQSASVHYVVPKDFASDIHDQDAFIQAINLYNCIQVGLDKNEAATMGKYREFIVELSYSYFVFGAVLECFRHYSSRFYSEKQVMDRFQAAIDTQIDKNIDQLFELMKQDKELHDVAQNRINAHNAWLEIRHEKLIKQSEKKEEKSVHAKKKKKKKVKNLEVKREEPISMAEEASEKPLENSPKNTEAEDILSEAMKCFSQGDYRTASSKYQLLVDYEDYRSGAWDGMLMCQIYIVIDQLERCIALFVELRRYDILDLEEQEECYAELKKAKAEYTLFLEKYPAIVSQFKQNSKTNSSQVDGIRFGLDILNESKEELAATWERCQQAKEDWEFVSEVKKYYRKMNLGAPDMDRKKLRELKDAGFDYYVRYEPEPIQKTNEFLLCQKVYAKGNKLFAIQARAYRKKYGESWRSKQRRLIQRYNDAFLPVESKSTSRVTAENPLPSSTAATVQTINSTDAPLNVEKQYDFVCSQFISADLLSNYNSLNESCLLSKLFQLDSPFQTRRQAHHKEITDALKSISEKIKSTSILEMKNDLVLAHIFSVILFYSIPLEILKENLSVWNSPILPIHRFCKHLNLSLTCQSALHSFLTVKCGSEEKKSNPHHIACLPKLQYIAREQVTRLMNEFNFKEMSFHLLIDGEHAVLGSHFGSPPLIQAESQKPSKKIMIRTNMPASLAEGIVDSSVNFKTSSMSMLKALEHSDFGMVVDVIGEKMVYLDDTKAHALKSSTLFLLYFDHDLLPNMKEEVAEFTNQCREEDRQKKNEFLSKLFKPSCLHDFLLSNFANGNALGSFKKAEHFHLIEFLFSIPVKALPLSKETLKTIKRTLNHADENRHDNPYDQLGRVVLEILYHSCLPLQDNVDLFKNACKHSIETLYAISQSELRLRITYGSTEYAKRMGEQMPSMTSKALLFAEKPGLQKPIEYQKAAPQ